MGFWTALEFLTILPAPRHRPLNEQDPGRSLVYFTLVGLLLGGILTGLYYGLSLILPQAVVMGLLVAALAALTGAHHLDGLIDSTDGVIAGKSKAERLAMMSDGRVGTFGIVAVALVLLLKYVALSAAPVLPALLLMPTLSRWSMVMAIFAFPYARSQGMGVAFKQGARWWKLTIATIITLVPAVILLEVWGIALAAAIWLVTYGLGSYFHSRLGGLTGDTYGAINEMVEVIVLIFIIIIWRF